MKTTAIQRMMICCSVALGWGLFFVPAASADTINIYKEGDPPYDGYYPNFIKSTQWEATNFVTDAITSGLVNLTVSQEFVPTPNSHNSHSFTVELWSNSGPGDPNAAHYSGTGLNTPGSLITQLVGNNDPAPGGLVSFDYTAPVNILPNTYYWVVERTTSSLNEYLPTYAQGSLSPVYGKRVELGDFSTNNGSTWFPSTNTNFHQVHADMTVTAVAAVPEPSSLVLLAAAGFAGYGWQRRKQRRHAASTAVNDPVDDAPATLAFPAHRSACLTARRRAA